MGKKKVEEEVVDETLEDASVVLDFDLEASELRVDSSDVDAIKALVEAHNFTEAGRVFVGDKELAVLRKK